MNSNLNLSLIEAVRDRKLNVVQKLLKQGVSANLLAKNNTNTDNDDDDDQQNTALAHLFETMAIDYMSEELGMDHKSVRHMLATREHDEKMNAKDSFSVIDNPEDQDKDDKNKGNYVSPLTLAIEREHLGIVKALLDAGASPDFTPGKKRPLEMALISPKKNDLMIKALLEAGASSNFAFDTIDPREETFFYASTVTVSPLMWLAQQNAYKLIPLCLKGGADINYQNPFKETALMFAAREGAVASLKLLLEHGAKVDARDEFNRTALMMAAAKGSFECVKLLLEAGAKPNLKTKLYYQKTALWYALESGDERCINTLLEIAPPTNLKNEGLLFCAVYGGCAKLVKAILDTGAPTDELYIRDSSKTIRGEIEYYDSYPLKVALERHHHACVKLLLDAGADYHKTSYRANKEATFYALTEEKCDKICLQYLLDAGVNLKARDEYQNTALHIVAGSSDSNALACAKLLMDAGIPPYYVNNAGKCALAFARNSNNKQMIRYLVQALKDHPRK